jgi:hypothetical protein
MKKVTQHQVGSEYYRQMLNNRPYLAQRRVLVPRPIVMGYEEGFLVGEVDSGFIVQVKTKAAIYTAEQLRIS